MEAPGVADGSYSPNSVSELQYFRIVANKNNESWRFKVYNKETYNVYNEYIENRKRVIKGFVNNRE